MRRARAERGGGLRSGSQVVEREEQAGGRACEEELRGVGGEGDAARVAAPIWVKMRTTDPKRPRPRTRIHPVTWKARVDREEGEVIVKSFMSKKARSGSAEEICGVRGRRQGWGGGTRGGFSSPPRTEEKNEEACALGRAEA